MLKKLLTPKEIINKFEDLDIEKYRSQGFNVILVDIDNTLESDFTLDPTQQGISRIKWLKDEGFHVIVYSNNTTKRVKRFCKDLDVEWYSWSCKPLQFVYHKIFRKHKFNKNEVMTIGDQIFTDVLGSNISGLTSVYVKPFSNDKEIYTKFNRLLERFVFKHVIKM